MGVEWWGLHHVLTTGWKLCSRIVMAVRYFRYQSESSLADRWFWSFKHHDLTFRVNGLWSFIFWKNDRCWESTTNLKPNYALQLEAIFRRSRRSLETKITRFDDISAVPKICSTLRYTCHKFLELKSSRVDKAEFHECFARWLIIRVDIYLVPEWYCQFLSHWECVDFVGEWFRIYLSWSKLWSDRRNHWVFKAKSNQFKANLLHCI